MKNGRRLNVISFKIETNKKEIENSLYSTIERILYAIGIQWMTYATTLITAYKAVDTGRLRASLSFVTPTSGKQKRRVSTSESDDYITGAAPENSLYVGTNVFYAIFIERTRPFLSDSLMKYKSKYESIAEKILKGEL